jgi:hypothetical protein
MEGVHNMLNFVATCALQRTQVFGALELRPCWYTLKNGECEYTFGPDVDCFKRWVPSLDQSIIVT